MRANSFAVALLIAMASAAALAQQSATTWSALNQAKGKRIAVVGNDNHSQSGQLEQVSDDSLTFTSHERRVVIRRDDICQVYTQSGRSRKKGALWGLAIGAGSGAIIGAAGTQPCDNCIVSFSRGEGAAVGAVAGAAVGTIAGMLIGGGRKKVLLYDSGPAVPVR